MWKYLSKIWKNQGGQNTHITWVHPKTCEQRFLWVWLPIDCYTRRCEGQALELHYPPPKTNMTMENPPFGDVFPIENGDFPIAMPLVFGCVSFLHVASILGWPASGNTRMRSFKPSSNVGFTENIPRTKNVDTMGVYTMNTKTTKTWPKALFLSPKTWKLQHVLHAQRTNPAMPNGIDHKHCRHRFFVAGAEWYQFLIQQFKSASLGEKPIAKVIQIV